MNQKMRVRVPILMLTAALLTAGCEPDVFAPGTRGPAKDPTVTLDSGGAGPAADAGPGKGNKPWPKQRSINI